MHKCNNKKVKYWVKKIKHKMFLPLLLSSLIVQWISLVELKTSHQLLKQRGMMDPAAHLKLGNEKNLPLDFNELKLARKLWGTTYEKFWGNYLAAQLL